MCPNARDTGPAEALLADFVETTSELVWRFDATGRFTYLSERYVDVIDVPVEEIIGHTIDELGWHAADMATRQAYETAIADKRPFRGLLFVQPKKSGQARLVSVTGRPIFALDGSYDGYRGVASDVTAIEKWRALTSTIAAKVEDVVGEDFLSGLVEAVVDVLGAQSAYVARFDHERRTVREIHLHASGQSSMRSDVSYDGLPSEIVAAGRPVVVPTGVTELYPGLKALNAFRDIEAYAAVPLVNSRGAVLGILAVIDSRAWDEPQYIETVLRLFSGRAAAEIQRAITDEERRTSHRKMAEVLAALDLAHDAIVLVDPSAHVIYRNRSAADLMGGPGDAAEPLLSDWAADPAFAEVAAGTLRTLATGEAWRGSVMRENGSGPKVYDAHAQELSTGGAVIVATDATDRSRLEEERRRKQERELQAGKLEVLGNLAGGIAHDFNNLLGAILGFGSFLLEDLDPASPQYGFAQRIVSASHRGRSLVQQILAFSRSSGVAPAAVPLRDTIAECADLLRMTLPVSTQLTIEIGAADAVVAADKGQLVQVLVNLCVNASDALSGKAGTVRIALDRLDKNRHDLQRLPPAAGRPSPSDVASWCDLDGVSRLATGGLPSEDCVSLIVEDTGSGIPPEILGDIFEPFRTTKGPGGGTGLGLAVVHRIVRAHGGAILVWTGPGGTRFEIILGATALEETAGEAAAPGERQGLAEQAAAILVVDDDRDYCEMIRTALARAGHRVRTTADARVALGLVRYPLERWDILVTDQTMPHTKGVDLVREVKSVSPRTSCIICTADAAGLSEQEARDAGAAGFLLKPFDTGRLLSLIAELMDQENAAES